MLPIEWAGGALQLGDTKSSAVPDGCAPVQVLLLTAHAHVKLKRTRPANSRYSGSTVEAMKEEARLKNSVEASNLNFADLRLHRQICLASIEGSSECHNRL